MSGVDFWNEILGDHRNQELCYEEFGNEGIEREDDGWNSVNKLLEDLRFALSSDRIWRGARILNGITNGGSAGAGGSGGRRGYPNPFQGFLSNRGLAGGDMANGFAVAGGLGGSPVQSSNGSGGNPIDVGGGGGGGGGDSLNSGHYPFGSGGGDSPLGGDGHSPFGSSGLGGPGIDDGESYPSVRSSVSVDMNEIVCIVRAKGRGKHRKLRTSVKVKAEKVRHAIRFKRANALQGLGEM